MFKVKALVGIVTFALILAISTMAGPTANAITTATISLGTAGSFAVLGGPAVTCTDATISGNVGAGFPGAPVTRNRCQISGTVHKGDAAAIAAYADFLSAWAAYAAYQASYCPTADTAHTLTGTLAGVTLPPGTYCVDATEKTGTLTLDGGGDVNAQWIFLVGSTVAGGALTGTNFSVVMAGGGVACNVLWWVAQAATMTTSNFLGTILAGAAITLTGGTFNGRALATGAVTVTGGNVTGCEAGSSGGSGKSKCNQGVGNGPEVCDPGNSNQGDPTRSNDELGGTPGQPGRMGGNK